MATRADASFDRYARMVQRYLEVPTALVSLTRGDTQSYPGAAGLGEPWMSTRESPAAGAFCRFVVGDDAPLVVDDARQEPALAGETLVRDLGVVAYAGWPLIDEEGRTIGALCALDTEPRAWTREDLDALSDLADACSAELLHRRRQEQAEVLARHALEMSHRSQALLSLSEGLSITRTLDDIAFTVEQVAVERLGCLHAGIWLRTGVVGDEDAPDVLRYVRERTVDWSSARLHGQLGLDDGNPVGECLVTGQSLFFPDAATQNVRYPSVDVTRQVGEARAFMPLSLGDVFGTLVLVWPDAGEVPAETRVTIAALTSYVAQAVQRAVLYEERVAASLTLQSAMLTRLPAPDGMDLTARYRPAAVHDRVGGDWYDAVLTASGDTNLMIGDVSGHSIAAAAVMGELRSMLRAFAWDHDDSPADNVTRLDAAMDSFEVGRFASLVFARVGPPDATGLRRLEWTNAGHFPPLLVHPCGRTELLDDGHPADLLLGIDPATDRRNQCTDVPAGSMLVLYTDGLIERRDESLEDGLVRLREAASRHHEHTPGRFLDAVVDDLVGSAHEDDVALLAIRFA